MAHVIATFALLTLMFLAQLGNFWFTYGLWPKSWASFAFFWFAGFLLHILFTAVTQELQRRGAK